MLGFAVRRRLEYWYQKAAIEYENQMLHARETKSQLQYGAGSVQRMVSRDSSGVDKPKKRHQRTLPSHF